MSRLRRDGAVATSSRRAGLAGLAWLQVLAACAPLTLIGCRDIAGYRALTYAGAEDAGCAPVALPATGSGRIRLVNVATSGATSDFCVRPTGTPGWGTPVFASSRASCDTGLAYATATVPFAVPAGLIDVEAVPVGAGCTAAPTSTASGLAVAESTLDEPAVTVILMGGRATERIVALPQDGPPHSYVTNVRVVNAVDGTQPLQVGLAVASTLPTTVEEGALIPAAIEPGGVEPAGLTGLGLVDANGYLALPTTEHAIGVVFEGEADAIVAATPVFEDTTTLFVIGEPGDNTYPLRGLLCEDLAPSAADGGPLAADASLLASCTLTALPRIAVDTWEVYLCGAFAQFESARREPIYDAIEQRTSDLMCLTNVNRFSDQQGIAAAAKAHFPYAYYPDPPAGLDTQPTDPRSIDGGVPPSPEFPPCNGIDLATIDSIYACLAQHCASPAGMDASIQTTSCVQDACLGQLLGLFQKGEQQDSCFDCIIYHAMSDEPLAYGKTECTTDKRQPFTFDGATSEMILSHYPLADEAVFILPSTGFRRSVVYAAVQFEDQTIDFYCTSPVLPAGDSELPYVGNYGRDAVDDAGQQVENGWEDEQDLQVKRTIAFVQANSKKTGHRVIIAGAWSSSTQVVGAQGQVLVSAYDPEVMTALGAAFTPAEPAGFVPTCDFCPAPENAYNGEAVNLDTETTFLLGFPSNSTTDNSVWGTGNVVKVSPPSIPYEPAPDGGWGPLSDTFGREVQIIRPHPSN
jgi:hypothetical protein